MRMKKLLVIGAGFLQDFVIRKAKSMGYEVLTVDADPNAVGFSHADKYRAINIVDEQACLAYAMDEKIDGVLTAATEYGVLTASYIAREMGLPGLDYEVARRIKNKYKVRKCLYENQVDDMCPVYEVNADTDIAALSDKIRFPVIVKPCDGSGSRGVSRVDDAASFGDACRFAMDHSKSRCATVEPFVFGKEYGSESIVVDGAIHVLGIMRKRMTNPPYYAELGHAIPSDLPTEIEERARECVKRAIRALGINFGSVNMDMIITDDGCVHIIDVGARMGGNLIGSCLVPYGTGIDYMASMIQIALGEEPDFTNGCRSAVASRLIVLKDSTVRRIPDFEELERQYDVEIYHHHLEMGQRVREYHTNLDGYGYIVARAGNSRLAIQKAETVLRLIQNILFDAD